MIIILPHNQLKIIYNQHKFFQIETALIIKLN